MSLDKELSTPMGWKLFLVARAVTNDAIASTFAEIFDIERASILVIESPAEIETICLENIKLICKRSPVQGDFQISVSIYPQDDELEQIIKKIDGEIEVMKRFADILECNCLILAPSAHNLQDKNARILVKIYPLSCVEVYLDLHHLKNGEYIIL
jgi:hypothetical protein